jgi:ubiquinone/menaquinone biosynthesis C-methylase UbiE
MSGTRCGPADLIDLALTLVARSRRRKLGGADTEAFYEDFFSELEVDVLTGLGDRRKNVRLSGVREALRPLVGVGDRVLDVGCGCGDNLLSLSVLDGIALFGIEYARANVDRATRLLGSRATIERASAFDLPYASEHFHAATCIEVLEHLTDDAAALSEIHRVLRPEGVLVLTLPHRHWFPAYRNLIGHERHYDRDSLLKLLLRTGFRIESYIPNFPRWHRAADYAYVAARIAGVCSAKLGGESAPHRVRLPGTDQTLLALLNRLIEPLYEADARLDYATRDASTSVVARRLPPFVTTSVRRETQ